MNYAAAQSYKDDTKVAVNADEILELLTNGVPLNIVRDIRNYFNLNDYLLDD